MGKFSEKINDFKNVGIMKNNTAYKQLVETIDNVDNWKGCIIQYNRIDIKIDLPDPLYQWMDRKIIKLDGVELYRNTVSSNITIEGDKITPSMDVDKFFEELIKQLKDQIVEI